MEELAAAATLEALSTAAAKCQASLAGFQDQLSQATTVLDRWRSLVADVAALSPGTMALVDRAMRDLHATIAVALLPAAQALADTAWRVASLIAPLAERLAPLLAGLAAVVESSVLVAVQALAGVVDANVSALWSLLGVVTSAAVAFDELFILITTLAAAFNLNNAAHGFDRLTQMLLGLADAVVLTTALMLRLVGATTVLNSLMNNLANAGETQPGGARAAPLSPGVTSLASIEQALEASAFAAQGAGQSDPLKEMAAHMKELAKEVAGIATMPLKDIIAAGVREGLRGAGSRAFGQAARGASQGGVAGAALGSILGPLGAIGGGVGGAIGGAIGGLSHE